MRRVAAFARLSLGVLLLVLIAAALARGPARAVAATGTRAVDFAQAVPDAAAARTAARAGGWMTLAARRAPGRFSLLGVRWRRGGDARVALRVRRTGGQWSRWITAAHVEDGAGLPRGAGETEPVWTGRADTYQLRVTRPLAGARVHFVSVTGAVDPARAAVAPAARAANGIAAPRIVPRSAWDPTGSCRPRTTPSYGRVDMAIVHHTETLAGYRPDESAAIVLSVCRYHRDGNGWNDIGYDLLVDKYGTVFEGRAGGIDEPVVGAHAQGFNAVSTGIAAIGSYTSAQLPDVALRSLAQVLAWRLSVAGLPAQGTIAEISGGGKLNDHPAGERVRFQRIAGHRDADATDCPGGALYAQLPRLRTLTAALLRDAPASTRLTISPSPAPLAPGGPLRLTGRLALADGTRPAGAAVVLQRSDGDTTWTPVTTVATVADGIWTVAAPADRNGRYRVVALDDGTASSAIVVHVAARVLAHAASAHVRAGRAVLLRGSTAPAKPRIRAAVDRRLSAGRYRHIRTVTVATDADGRFAAAIRLPRAGLYRLTVTTPADATNAAGAAPATMVRGLK